MTKIKIDLHDALVKQIGGNTVHIPAMIEIDEMLEFSDIADHEIDVDELLQEQHIMADFWHVEDVKEHRPDLNDSQCWEVLKLCQDYLRADEDYRIGTIVNVAEELFGLESNQIPERVKRFDGIISEYQNVLSDVLIDARHWSDANDQDFTECDNIAHLQYLNELNSKE